MFGQVETQIFNQKQSLSRHQPHRLKVKFFSEIMVNHNKKIKSENKKASVFNIKASRINKSLMMSTTTSIKQEKQQQLQLEKKTLYQKGHKIVGTWINGQLHGQTIIQYKSGDYFEGLYSNGCKVEGLFRFKDGTEYRGLFQNNKFHGKGILKDNNQRVITCQWNMNKPSIKARIDYPNGDIYYGQVKKLKKHGNGYLFFKNGQKYVGQFNNGAITGLGCLYNHNVLLAQGQWTDGILQSSEICEEDSMKLSGPSRIESKQWDEEIIVKISTLNESSSRGAFSKQWM